jgi:putative PIN family toxin of toxin-antitoxin system
VFLDTNVLVSAFATRGLCADLFELVLLEHHLVLGGEVIGELRRALRRKLKLPPQVAEEIVSFVSEEASQIAGESPPAVLKADPADARVLGEALAAGADIFVTGDAALLRVRMLRSMRIVSPRGFWEFLHTREDDTP